MADSTESRLSAWASNQALTVVSRVVTLVLVPVVFAAGGKLLAVSDATVRHQQVLAEQERRLSAVEAQQRQADSLAASVRSDLTGLVVEQQAMRRQLERIERLLERRADAGGAIMDTATQ